MVNNITTKLNNNSKDDDFLQNIIFYLYLHRFSHLWHHMLDTEKKLDWEVQALDVSRHWVLQFLSQISSPG